MSGASLYLNTYGPLVLRPAGHTASDRFGIPPFVDGSVRREPDLEHAFPAITCLCRGGLFAPRLRPDDVVVYMTKLGRYADRPRHHRITAVLRVGWLFDSHAAAADWYIAQGLTLPSNCMVEGNPPVHVTRTHRKNANRYISDDDEFTRRWDVGYRQRARRHGRFVVCEATWRDLSWSAPIVHDEDLETIFGKVPGTRNPGRLPITRLEPLLQRCCPPAPPSAR